MCVVPGELRGETVHWEFDGWAGRESWLRIWVLSGLPIVPGLLLLFIEDSTLPVPCAVISPSTEAKAAQWFHWRFMITEGLVVDQRVMVLWAILCTSVSEQAAAYLRLSLWISSCPSLSIQNISNYKMEGVSVSVLWLSRQLFIRSTSHLVDVLLRTQGSSVSSVKLFG